MSYAINQAVRCTARCYAGPDATFPPLDPTQLVFKCLSPSGALLVYTWPGDVRVVRDALGVFHVDVVVDVGGSWSYRFNATGAVVAAGEATFLVAQSSFGTP